jgi:hypothetical protein
MPVGFVGSITATASPGLCITTIPPLGTFAAFGFGLVHRTVAIYERTIKTFLVNEGLVKNPGMKKDR